jgi:peptidoglycan LD-endopeptidase CwlK
MVVLGAVSQTRLATCKRMLQFFVWALVDKLNEVNDPKLTDITVLCGFRNQADQEDAWKRGASKLHFPFGKHNKQPSDAVDIAPYPVDYKNKEAFLLLGKYGKQVLEEQELLGKIEWGGDWTTFVDLPHWQLKG